MERVSRDEARADPTSADAPPGADRGPAEPETKRPTEEGGAGTDLISFEQIRERAYELWERNHRPEGFEIQFWLLAERELRAERERGRAGGA